MLSMSRDTALALAKAFLAICFASLVFESTFSSISSLRKLSRFTLGGILIVNEMGMMM
jgi:hypothetical protein